MLSSHWLTAVDTSVLLLALSKIRLWRSRAASCLQRAVVLVPHFSGQTKLSRKMHMSFSHLGESQEPALVMWLGGKEKDPRGAQRQNCRSWDLRNGHWPSAGHYHCHHSSTCTLPFTFDPRIVQLWLKPSSSPSSCNIWYTATSLETPVPSITYFTFCATRVEHTHA